MPYSFRTLERPLLVVSRPNSFILSDIIYFYPFVSCVTFWWTNMLVTIAESWITFSSNVLNWLCETHYLKLQFIFLFIKSTLPILVISSHLWLILDFFTLTATKYKLKILSFIFLFQSKFKLNWVRFHFRE